LGRIDKASAVAVGDINQSNSFTSGDSDSDDLDGTDLELEVDVEFMVQTLFWTKKEEEDTLPLSLSLSILNYLRQFYFYFIPSFTLHSFISSFNILKHTHTHHTHSISLE
jgi:hypothetical protein